MSLTLKDKMQAQDTDFRSSHQASPQSYSEGPHSFSATKSNNVESWETLFLLKYLLEWIIFLFASDSAISLKMGTEREKDLSIPLCTDGSVQTKRWFYSVYNLWCCPSLTTVCLCLMWMSAFLPSKVVDLVVSHKVRPQPNRLMADCTFDRQYLKSMSYIKEMNLQGRKNKVGLSVWSLEK